MFVYIFMDTPVCTCMYKCICVSESMCVCMYVMVGTVSRYVGRSSGRHACMHALNVHARSYLAVQVRLYAYVHLHVHMYVIMSA